MTHYVYIGKERYVYDMVSPGLTGVQMQSVRSAVNSPVGYGKCGYFRASILWRMESGEFCAAIYKYYALHGMRYNIHVCNVTFKPSPAPVCQVVKNV